MFCVSLYSTASPRPCLQSPHGAVRETVEQDGLESVPGRAPSLQSGRQLTRRALSQSQAVPQSPHGAVRETVEQDGLDPVPGRHPRGQSD
ncbi:hypothetical protein ACOMHN_019961 [Nucella lapillus]